MRTIVSLLLSSLAMLLLGSTVHAEAAVPRPFSATYAVSFRGIGAGTITFDFARDAATGRYIYETHASPSTLARLFVSKAAMERSVMEIDDSGTRPIDWFARGRLLLQNGRAWLDGKPLDAPLREPSPALGG